MSRADQLRAELALAELEDELVAAKGKVERCEKCGRRVTHDSPDLADLKARVRQARYEARLEREGGATANPATVQVKSSVNKPGGSR